MYGLWQRIFPNQLLNDLIDAYNKLSEEERQPMNVTRRFSVENTASVGCPSIETPRETLDFH